MSALCCHVELVFLGGDQAQGVWSLMALCLHHSRTTSISESSQAPECTGAWGPHPRHAALVGFTPTQGRPPSYSHQRWARRALMTYSAWGLRKVYSTLKWQHPLCSECWSWLSPLSSTFALKVRSEKKQRVV